MLRAGKELIAKEACGATNSTRFPFNRPSSRAVKLLELLCTNPPISSRRTRGASADCRICAFLEGQTVATKLLKFEPLRYGRSYRIEIDAEYQSLDTSAQE